MSGYTSGNKAPTLMAQAPNRKGNISKMPPRDNVGVTAVTNPNGSVQYAAGKSSVAKVPAHGNPNNGATGGRGQKVAVSMPTPYCTYTHNDGYMNSDRTNYLK